MLIESLHGCLVPDSSIAVGGSQPRPGPTSRLAGRSRLHHRGRPEAVPARLPSGSGHSAGQEDARQSDDGSTGSRADDCGPLEELISFSGLRQDRCD